MKYRDFNQKALLGFLVIVWSMLGAVGDGFSATVPWNGPGTTDEMIASVPDVREINSAQTSTLSMVLPSPWLNADIGEPGVGGSVNHLNGTFTLEGAGKEINGNTDEFYYVYQGVSGNHEIIARVNSLSASGDNALAGVMIRSNLSNRSAHGTVGFNNKDEIKWESRGHDGGGTFQQQQLTDAQWVKLVKTDGMISSYASEDGSNWELFYEREINIGSDYYIGLLVNSSDTDELATGVFSSVTIKNLNTELPSPWETVDVGEPAISGAASYEEGSFTVVGSGKDIWNDSDQFHFVYQPVVGNIEITARVNSVSNSHIWAKAGVMIRERLDEDSKYAMMLARPNMETAFQRRLTTGEGSVSTSGSGNSAPVWLKLSKRGSELSAYQSADGVSWVLVDTESIEMTGSFFIGLAVTSHDVNVTCTANISDVVVNSDILSAPTLLEASSVSTTSVQLQWNDQSTNEIGFKIERSVANENHFEEIAVTGADTNGYLDQGLQSSTTYFYRVRAYNEAGTSAYSEHVSTTTGDLLEGELPSPWLQSKVGESTIEGAAYYENGTFMVQGNGKEIHGNTDEFHMVFQEVSGDQEIIARVESFTGGGENALAGIMVRYNLGERAAMVVLGFNHKSELKWFSRRGEGNGTFRYTRDATSPWIRLVKVDQLISAYISADGSNWEPIFEREIEIDLDCLVGLMVNSDDTEAISTGVFSDVIVRDVTVLPAPPSELVVAQTLTGNLVVDWVDNSYNETGFKIERSLQPNSGFEEVYVTGPDVMLYEDSGLDVGTTYYYRVQAINAAGASSYTVTESATSVSGTSLFPEPWQNTDVGNPTAEGFASYADGQFYLWGGGSDVSGNKKDEFHFVYQPLLRNGVIIAKVNQLKVLNKSTEAGIMVRESLAGTDTRMFTVMTSGDRNSELHGLSRDRKRGASRAAGKNLDKGTPIWIKVVKDGTYMLSYHSENGVDWELFYDWLVPLDDEVYAGLMAYSNSSETVSRAVFSDVSVQQVLTPGSPRELAVSVNALSTEVSLAWEDHSKDEEGFVIERSTQADTGYEVIATVGSNVKTYTDTDAPLTTCYYRVKATDSFGDSDYSNVEAIYVGSLPEPWFSKSIGYEAGLDTAVFKDDVFTIFGSEAGLAGSADQVQYLYQNVLGDGEVVAHISDFSFSGSEGKVGLMIRESLTPEAKTMAMGVSGNGRLFFQERSATAGNVTMETGASIGVSTWLKLARRGNVYTIYHSSDGVNWVNAGETNFVMSDNTFFGLMASSGENSSQVSGVFESVNISRFNAGRQVLDMLRWAGDYDKTDLDNVIRVTTTPDTVNRRNTYTGMLGKTIEVDLAESLNPDNATISFKFIPDSLDQTLTVFTAGGIELLLEEDQLSLLVGGQKVTGELPVSFVICNHVVVRLSKNEIGFYFNGRWQVIPNTLSSDVDEVVLNSYRGQTWDVQVYEGLLTDTEVTKISELCVPEVDVREHSPYGEEYVQAICNAYSCLWAPEDIDLREDRFLLNLWGRDKAFEYFTFRAGMYIHGNLEESIKNYLNPRIWLVYEVSDNLFPNGKFDYTGVGSAYWAHETFHGYQGFHLDNPIYSGSKWLCESTAEWGASFRYDDIPNAGVTGITINPHLPLKKYGTYEVPDGHRDYHSYILFSYITRFVSTPFFMGKMFNYPNVSGNEIKAIEDILADEGHDFKEVFTDYASRTTVWDYVDGSGPAWAQNEEQGIQDWITNGFENFNYKFTDIMDENGTEGVMTAIPEALRPGAYSWNAYKVTSTVGGVYNIKLRGSDDNTEEAFFKGKVITGTPGNYQYRDLDISKAVALGNEEVLFTTPTQEGEELYLVVTSIPENTYSVEPRYDYEYAIEAVESRVNARATSQESNELLPVIAYPNTNDGHLTIALQEEEVVEQVVITNLNGQVISSDFTQSQGSLHVEFESDKGIYLMQLSMEGNLQTIKLIKE